MHAYIKCIFIALAIYSRSPAAFKALKSLKILDLPSERTVKTHMNECKKSPGLDGEDLRQSALLYEKHIEAVKKDGKPLPLGEGLLIWDETKVNLH